MPRLGSRRDTGLRNVAVSYDIFGYADASILLEFGNTKVLCCVTLQAGVPFFLKGKGIGWLNAEYAMLPTATVTRTQRESTQMVRPGRSVEISRLLGRSLRTVVDCTVLGERTICIDCDVLQADGGTRVVAITGASLVLQRVQKLWLQRKVIPKPILEDNVVAVSVGVTESGIIVDPDYAEDAAIWADFNFVVTKSGFMIEVQGGAERRPISWETFDKVRFAALQAAKDLFALFDHQDDNLVDISQEKKVPFFSLQNRLSCKQST
jgi:ribonuclease PH